MYLSNVGSARCRGGCGLWREQSSKAAPQQAAAAPRVPGALAAVPRLVLHWALACWLLRATEGGGRREPNRA
ncbi:hypothetical protein E2562_001968 [Oryza meyeriana var. granulata]|uniref:Uncharacterized protein n=1 Tax=Oryza meyeriana var. granulata TaxID=110450 RepID=A0A6G1C1Z6_9ORYZ|nr:hypothetical protein E2562_001968 [Oryza meyeriana var. granulata]